MKNEEKTLNRLFDSMKSFFKLGGKVYAVDTGSTDKSVEIAKSYGVEVIEEGDKHFWKLTTEEKSKFLELVGQEEYSKWEKLFPDFGFFNYTAARNSVAQHAKTDWLLTVDCDEMFLQFDPLYIDYWCRTNKPQDMSSFPFIWAKSPTGGEVINNTVRIWNKTCSHWVRYVHEHIEGFSKLEGGKCETLDKTKVFMEHFQNQEETSIITRKSRLFGLFKDYLDHPNIGRASHYLGREFMYFHMWEAAIKMFNLNLSHEPWDIQRMSSCIFKGDCLANAGKAKEAIYSWFEAFEHYDKTRLPAMRLAHYYYINKNHFKAKIWANTALQISYRIDFLEEPQNYRHYPHEILYWALYWLGEKEESKKHYLKAVEYFPNNPKYIDEAKFFK